MATFTLATGLRASNVTEPSWKQVDLGRRLAWIHPDQAKARRAIAVPLNGTASRASGGAICAIPGPRGTCRTERRSLLCRNSRAGRPRRWCGAMRLCALCCFAAGHLAVYARNLESHDTDTAAARQPDFCGTAIPTC